MYLGNFSRLQSHTSALRHLQRAAFAMPALASLVTLALQEAKAQESAAADRASGPERILEEITISARRVDESVLDVPVSISVIGADAVQTLGIRGFEDYGGKIPNLSFQYGASDYGYAGNRSVTIRGISGFDTTGFYIDDTPVNVAIDPLVVDVQRIEVLKGPQGTLYGAGSMGGNVRIVTQQPTFDNTFSYSLSIGYTDHGATPDGRAVGTGNLSLIDDVAALRITAAVEHQGGFVTRAYPQWVPGMYEMPATTLQPGSDDNQGAVLTAGGSVTLLVKPTENFSAKLRVMGQYGHTNGRAVQYAPFPEFKPLDSYTLPVIDDFQEEATNTWVLPALELSYSGAGWTLTSATSYYEQEIIDKEDNVRPDLDFVYLIDGVVLAAPTGGGDHWRQDLANRSFNQELRVGIDQIGPFRAIVGVRYERSTGSRHYGCAHLCNEGGGASLPGLAASGLFPTDVLWATAGGENGYSTDKSIFGETYWRMGKFELTLGARKFWLHSVDGSGEVTDGYINGGLSVDSAALRASESGVSPKAALTYDVANNSMLYASASKGFRRGGVNSEPNALCDPGLEQLGFTREEVRQYESDNIWNYEVGGKTQVGGLLITAAAFHMDWTDIQQLTLIPVCQTGTLTLNIGKARVRGMEFEAVGTVFPGLQAMLGFGYQDAKLLSGSSVEVGGSSGSNRLQGAPEYSGSLALTYTRPVTTSLEGFVSSDYAYQGSSLSSVSNGERAAYGMWNARFGVQWDDGRSELSLYARNITNEMANLGDLARFGLQPYDSNGELLMQVVIPRPRQIGLQFTRGL